MDVERFRDSPIGRVVPISVEQHRRQIEHFAYVPDPLPGALDLRPETYRALEGAAMELGMLQGAASRFDSPYLLTRPSIRREAVSTSALEGTFATLQDIYAADVTKEPPEDLPTREVMNYVSAAEAAVAELSRRSVSRNLLLEVHRTLLRGTPDERFAGRVRDGQVAIGSRGASVAEARFVPPPPGPELEDLFVDWERWNYREDDIPVLARIAVSHYQLETIHPFFEGNGRIGRLVAVLLLIDLGPLTDHFLVLSPYLEARRDRYQEMLSHVSASGDFDAWVHFFADAIHAQAGEARNRMDALLAYRSDAVQRLRGLRMKGTVIALAERLIEQPVVTPTSVAADFGISYQTANRAIGRLVQTGYLEEVTGRRYQRVFVARDVLQIMR